VPSKKNISLLLQFQTLFAIVIILSIQFDSYGQNMEFEQSLYDFGQVQINSNQVHELKFKNTGEETLIIKSEPKTASSADVARIKGGKMKYAPNEEGVIIYQFSTKSPKFYHNNITIQSETSVGIIRVEWEVLPDSIHPQSWQEKIEAHPALKENIATFYEYERSQYNYRMPDPINDHLEQLRFDSIQNLCVEEMGKLFSPEELLNVFTFSEDIGIKLISFEAISRTNYNTESIVDLLANYYMNKCNIYTDLFNNHSGVYGSCLKMISPYDKTYTKSTKLDLESYVFLEFLNSFYELYIVIYNKDSFGVRDTLDFRTIDLSNYKKETFELHGKIPVVNISEKTIIIAPYYDSKTTCDKRSYNLNGKGGINIDFRSVVKLKEGEQTIKRALRIVDYKTKEEKTVWIKAKFINYKKE
jgi:hypothetical protein